MSLDGKLVKHRSGEAKGRVRSVGWSEKTEGFMLLIEVTYPTNRKGKIETWYASGVEVIYE